MGIAPMILWEPGAHVLAAVSGGCDSVALLLMLCDAAQRGEIRLSAAHFEHGIRGEESIEDARFVQDLCGRLGVPLKMGGEDVPALARSRGIGLEQAAREARHAFLMDAKARTGADVVALAHHSDDQAETVLMHILRGAGPKGASGMRPVEGALIRPLLRLSRAQLSQYLIERGQPYCTDSTNLIPEGPRNRLRLHVMPEIKAIYPGAVGALCRHAEIARGEDELISRLTENWLDANARALPMGVRLRALPDAESALVRRALMRLIPEPSYCALERLERLYFSASGKLSLPGGPLAERTGAALYVLRPGVSPPGPVPLLDGARLEGLGVVRIHAAEAVPVRGNLYRQAVRARAFLGAELRTRRSGDRFQMMGAPGDRLLSDVLVDRKVERPLRDYLPLVALGNRVLWVPGIGLSEQARLAPGDEALMLHYEGLRILDP